MALHMEREQLQGEVRQLREQVMAPLSAPAATSAPQPRRAAKAKRRSSLASTDSAGSAGTCAASAKPANGTARAQRFYDASGLFASRRHDGPRHHRSSWWNMRVWGDIATDLPPGWERALTADGRVYYVK